MELKLFFMLIVQLVQNYVTSSPNSEYFNTCKEDLVDIITDESWTTSIVPFAWN